MDNRIKTAVLLASLSGLMLLLGEMLGGVRGLAFALVFSILMNFFSYWYSDRVVLAIYRAKPADRKDYGELHRIIEELASKAALPKPRIYVIPSENPNAFATGRDEKHAAVAVTSGILRLLNRDQLKGVLAHEINHIRHHDILISTIAATIASVISYAAFMGRFLFFFGRSDDNKGLEEILLLILAPIAALIIQLAISRSREYMADEGGARLVGSGKPLADALEILEKGSRIAPMKGGNRATEALFIVNPFRADVITGLFSTHPPTKERIRRLREMRI